MRFLTDVFFPLISKNCFQFSNEIFQPIIFLAVIIFFTYIYFLSSREYEPCLYYNYPVNLRGLEFCERNRGEQWSQRKIKSSQQVGLVIRVSTGDLFNVATGHAWGGNRPRNRIKRFNLNSFMVRYIGQKTLSYNNCNLN